MIMKLFPIITPVVLLLVSMQVHGVEVRISTSFPGGNVVVEKIDGRTIHLDTDLRGGQPWFYWCFDATVANPGKVLFDLGKPQKIGVRGPAVSIDEGKSWNYLGTENVEMTPQAERFTYEFTKVNQRVRFAVAIPYLQHDLNAFITKNAANPFLVKSELTKTRKGTSVDLLRIGKPGPGVSPILVTARHHACESTASYVLEGFLQEALSESLAGKEFRKRHVLFAVPIVDKDGVEAGDQGKNRMPHDHNRDYGDNPIYPEIQAISDIANKYKIHFAIDFHCPALRGDIHEAMHFLGLGVPHVKDNLNEWISWIKEERPQEVMAPLNFLVDPTKPGAVNRKINSHYMATLGSCKMAATLEVPYTQVRPALDSDMARAYGAGLLKAWVRTNFITIDAGMNRGDSSNAHFNNFRNEFIKSYRSKPKEMEELANRYRTEQSPMHYRLEAANLLATLSISQRKYPEAKVLTQSVLLDANASTYQYQNAMLLNMEATVKDPKSGTEEVDALFVKAIALPYSALSYRAKVYDLASEFARRQMDYRTAIKRTRDQILVAAFYERGRLWNRIATDFEALKLPDEALGARKEAIKLLRPVLDPAEVSVFGAMMTLDYFDALYGISETPISELEVAAQKVLNHKVSSIAMKEHVTKLLKERK